MKNIRDVKDTDAIIKYEKLTAQTPGYLVSNPEELTPAYYNDLVRQLDSNALFIIAESENIIVGHAYLLPMILRAIKHVFRLTIAVHPDYLNQGIGSSLMDYLINWATEHRQLEKIELMVRANNKRAIHLYEKFGFKTEGI